MTFNVKEAINQLNQERKKYERVIAALELYAQNGTQAEVLNAEISGGRPRKYKSKPILLAGKRHMSRAGRAAIAEAQRKRWAKFHRDQK